MNKKAKKCSTSKGNINGRGNAVSNFYFFVFNLYLSYHVWVYLLDFFWAKDEEIEEVELSDDIDNKSSDDESDMPTQIQRTKSGKWKGNILNFDAAKQKLLRDFI
jgi:hypothetical protein